MQGTHDPQPRYGMVVDLNRCVGCQTCTIACKHANDTPPGVQWRRVLDVERGRFPDVERLFLVVGCQHCADPPCVPVCPTGATRQRSDGLVTMDYDSCIGCGYCAVACPYQARTIVHDKDWYYGQPTRQEQAVYHDERVGVASKCTFCVDKIDEADALGTTPGVDLEHTPACAMHEELGTDPQIRYLYEVPSSTPGREPAPEDDEDERLRDLENPLVGRQQTFWDQRAAMNFTLGGLSSGLALVAAIAWALGALRPEVLPLVFAGAAVGMAVGLASVFLEIGRKARFLYVLRRPQTSWMTRETYAVAVFYPAVALDLLAPAPWLHAAVALAAAAFLICQVKILHRARGIPAWRAPLVPWLLGATGLLEGTGVLGIALAAYPAALGAPAGGVAVGALGVVLSVLTATLWGQYLGSARARGIGPLARDRLSAIAPAMWWVGYAVPAAGFALGAALGVGHPIGGPALALGGIGAVAGGVLLKFTLVTRAGHQQGYAMPKLPRRGSGERAAPIRLEPIARSTSA